ncbi:DUF4376 domain-containing protein [Pseudooceanicola sp. 502str34]
MTENIDYSRVVTAEDKAAEVQAGRKAALYAERERRLEAGTTLGLSFGAVPVRGRPFDQTVMLGIMQKAMALQASASTDTLTFRDDANTIHQLTATQAIELASAGVAWVEAVMAASWTMVDGGAIPEDFAADSRWPG